MFFLNANRKILEVHNVIDELYDFVKQDPNHQYDLLVGSDSKRRKDVVTNVTVVFLWDLVSRKFRFFFNRETYNCRDHRDIAGRIIYEASKSLEVAHMIEQSILMDILPADVLEVHLDVGYNGKSAKVMDACVGMVRGYGYKCKIKPDAWIASCVADRYTR